MSVGRALPLTLCFATCTIAPSWMFVNAPTLMAFTSPRSTAPYQMDDLAQRATARDGTLSAAIQAKGAAPARCVPPGAPR